MRHKKSMIPIGKSLKFQKKNKVFTDAYCFGKCAQWLDQLIGSVVSPNEYELFCKITEQKLSIIIKSHSVTQATWIKLELPKIQEHICQEVKSDVRLQFIEVVEAVSKY